MGNEFPALSGGVVTEAHARRCAENGHAEHVVDGVSTGTCPRCGAVTEQVTATDARAALDRAIRKRATVRRQLAEAVAVGDYTPETLTDFAVRLARHDATIEALSHI